MTSLYPVALIPCVYRAEARVLQCSEVVMRDYELLAKTPERHGVPISKIAHLWNSSRAIMSAISMFYELGQMWKSGQVLVRGMKAGFSDYMISSYPSRKRVYGVQRKRRSRVK